MIEELSKLVLVYLELNFLYNSMFLSKMLHVTFSDICKPVWMIWLYISIFFTCFYQKYYMWHFLIYKLVRMIWLSYKYFLYYFLVLLCIRSNLNFFLNHERYYLKIYGAFHFSDIQCYVIFFRWKYGIFGPLSLKSNPYPQKNPWYIPLYRCIPLDLKF